MAQEGPSTQPAAPVIPAEDKTSLEGTWMLVSAQQGEDRMSDDEVAGKRISFVGATMYMLDKGEDVAGASDKVAFRLDESSEPKAITLQASEGMGESLLGIYKVEDGMLTLVLSGPGQPRPTAFDAANTMRLVLKKS
ncbi:MAG TPA: TIGR03067 domain-containing protein, partial [Tepidisphaeraceae bacterium]|nr:TIGR03067 domain-containing protein [Tepidisphaeraceae bacterium]